MPSDFHRGDIRSARVEMADGYRFAPPILRLRFLRSQTNLVVPCRLLLSYRPLIRERAVPDLLKPEDFATLTDPLTVTVKVGEAVTVIELTVLAVQPRPPHRFREAPFSLTLSGPRSPSLPQGTYAVRHPELGVVELFLVPAGRDAQFTQYEVTFN